MQSKKKHKIAKVLLLISAAYMAGLGAWYAWDKSQEENVKTSVVVGAYADSFMDGCDGFELENGDQFDTFCFFGHGDNESTVVKRPIEIGDTVEYGTKGEEKFIRLKQGFADYYWVAAAVALVLAGLLYVNNLQKKD